jgi:hypothetical protein
MNLSWHRSQGLKQLAFINNPLVATVVVVLFHALSLAFPWSIMKNVAKRTEGFFFESKKVSLSFMERQI